MESDDSFNDHDNGSNYHHGSDSNYHHDDGSNYQVSGGHMYPNHLTTYGMNPSSTPSSKAGPRRGKRVVPDTAKDDKYWEKRQKNNDAARRSREVKRRLDMDVKQRVQYLEIDNSLLRKELQLVKTKFGLPLDQVFVDKDMQNETVAMAALYGTDLQCRSMGGAPSTDTQEADKQGKEQTTGDRKPTESADQKVTIKNQTQQKPGNGQGASQAEGHPYSMYPNGAPLQQIFWGATPNATNSQMPAAVYQMGYGPPTPYHMPLSPDQQLQQAANNGYNMKPRSPYDDVSSQGFPQISPPLGPSSYNACRATATVQAMCMASYTDTHMDIRPQHDMQTVYMNLALENQTSAFPQRHEIKRSKHFPPTYSVHSSMTMGQPMRTNPPQLEGQGLNGSSNGHDIGSNNMGLQGRPVHVSPGDPQTMNYATADFSSAKPAHINTETIDSE